MLDAHADRERFRLHDYTAVIQQMERFACGMSAGNYQRGAALLTARTFHRPYLAAAHGNACQRGFKAYLAAERDYLAAYIFHDRFEHVRADVRLGFCEYRAVRAEACEVLQNAAAEGVFYARGQLAVGKSARAALAELDVAVFVKLAARPKSLDLLRALIDLRALFKHQRTVAAARQSQRAEHSRRAEASYYRSALALFIGKIRLSRFVRDTTKALFRAKPLLFRGVGKLEIDRVDEVDIAAFASVERGLVNIRQLYFIGRNSAKPARFFNHLALIGADGSCYLINGKTHIFLLFKNTGNRILLRFPCLDQSFFVLSELSETFITTSCVPIFQIL
ncbi:unknown [Ruminococcus sp. CAG:579]|nr:unknown [Ruminococcus sp. CAG:579]